MEFSPHMLGDEWLGKWPTHRLPSFRASHWKTARRCMEQFRLSYLKEIKTPPQKALLWGTADHWANEVNFSQKILTHADLETDLVLDAFRDSVIQQVDDAGGITEVKWSDDESLTGADAKQAMSYVIDDGTRLVGLYHEEVSPSVKPLAVEESFSFDVSGLPVPMSGRIDLREQSRLIDGKTAGRAKLGNDNRFQGRFYSVVYDLPVDFHIKVKPHTPAGKISVLHDTDFLREDVSDERKAITLLSVRKTMAWISWNYETYGEDEPWEDALDHEWACTYCGYRDQGLCVYQKA